MAIDLGGSAILLTDQGFGERFKRQGEKFELCSQGRLLLLALWPENIVTKPQSGHFEFHYMNDVALTISSLPATARLAVKDYGSI